MLAIGRPMVTLGQLGAMSDVGGRAGDGGFGGAVEIDQLGAQRDRALPRLAAAAAIARSPATLSNRTPAQLLGARLGERSHSATSVCQCAAVRSHEGRAIVAAGHPERAARCGTSVAAWQQGREDLQTESVEVDRSFAAGRVSALVSSDTSAAPSA